LLVNTLSTIALGAQPPPGSTPLAPSPLAGPAASLAAAAARAARALAPGVLVPGEGLAVRKGRLADEPAEADVSAPADGGAAAPLARVPL